MVILTQLTVQETGGVRSAFRQPPHKYHGRYLLQYHGHYNNARNWW